MVFNSYHFIVFFLPITFFLYFGLNKRNLIVEGKAWLVAASLFFYAYWNVKYLPLIIGSILVNFTIGTRLAKARHQPDCLAEKIGTLSPRLVLTIGIIANLSLLGYFKYTDFFINNVNSLFGVHLALHNIALPLAISFFTFTQIIYLVDSYRGETADYDLLNYALFVTFFPHLIAGPIVHHQQIMPQFASRSTLICNYSNVLRGLLIFSTGFFKKVVIADTFGVWAAQGFDCGEPLNFFSAWAACLSYTFQLYFDFSGYCDMAIGASLLFNIILPVNFDSPYKALDIQDFWRRWHITLGQFLRNYLYIPLGGNRCGELRTYANLFMTFVLGGLWHGATWMFVIWGGLHGGALVIHRLWTRFHKPLPAAFAWTVTFLFLNVGWVFFRAKSFSDALRLLRGMTDIHSIFTVASNIRTSDLAWGGFLSDALLNIFPGNLVGQLPVYLAFIFAFYIITQNNSLDILHKTIGKKDFLGGIVLFVLSMYLMLGNASSVFLYFNF